MTRRAPKYWSLQELAQRWSVSINTIRRWIRDGHPDTGIILPACRLGARRLGILDKDAAAFAKKHFKPIDTSQEGEFSGKGAVA